MKKLLMMTMMMVTLTATMAVSAVALEYQVDAPADAMFAPATSVEQVTVVGGGATEADNIDRSKNAALIPPPFGSPESNQNGSGAALTPDLAVGGEAGGTITGNAGGTYYPPADTNGTGSSVTVTPTTKFTLPDGLYYSDGSLGRLKIPKLGLSVKVYEDESLESLSKGAGHFKFTSCWDGNVGLAGHNRGVANHFGQIHTLRTGNLITYSTKLGTRTYEVFFVGQISETDFSRLGRTSDNIITLVTCVRDVREMRWCVQGREVT